MQINSKLFVIMLGPPGSGKGTQSYILSQNIGLSALSTGEMLRSEISNVSGPFAQKLNKIINAGNLIPDDIMTEMLLTKLNYQKYDKGAILDGYPRNSQQVDLLNSIMEELDVKCRYYAVYLDVEDSEIIERLSGRFYCAQCGRGYHTKYMKTKKEGVCDHCSGTEFMTRQDDAPELIKHRLKVYKDQTEQVIDCYDKLNKLIRINSGNKTADEINTLILNELKCKIDEENKKYNLKAEY